MQNTRLANPTPMMMLMDMDMPGPGGMASVCERL